MWSEGNTSLTQRRYIHRYYRCEVAMVYAYNCCRFLYVSLLGKVKTFGEETAIKMPTGTNIKSVRLVFNSDPLFWSNWNLECWFLQQQFTADYYLESLTGQRQYTRISN